jgi:excisionase family DNA binding protein
MKQTTHYERISTMLTTGEVARLLNVHDSTVRRWNDRGIIKAYRIGPQGERRFRRDDIAIFFLDRAVQKFVQE